MRARRKGARFITGETSICNATQGQQFQSYRLSTPRTAIVSTIDVSSKATISPMACEIDNDEQHDYDQHDIDFLTGFANVLAEAVATSARTAVCRRPSSR